MRQVAQSCTDSRIIGPGFIDIQVDVLKFSRPYGGKEVPSAGWQEPTSTHTNLDFGFRAGNASGLWVFINTLKEVVTLRDRMLVEQKQESEIAAAIAARLAKIGAKERE